MLLRDRVGPRVALAAVLVYASFVASPILQVAYTESLAMLLLAGFLLALSRERWLVAVGARAGPRRDPAHRGAAVAAGGPWRGRPALAPPVGRAASREGQYCPRAPGLVACGVAGLAWPAIAWAVTGVRSAYTDTMATWRRR